MRITNYNDGIAYFYCEDCELEGIKNFKSMIKDDCVFTVDVVCNGCSETKTLYFLRCTTEYKSKELAAELKALRSV